jgi:transporter family protein
VDAASEARLASASGSGWTASTRWLIPTLSYVVMVGLLGVTTKLALEDMRWPKLVLWTAFAYAVIAIGLVGAGQRRLDLNRGAAFAAASGVLAACALIMLFLALDAGEVSRVVPITSSYPVVTVLLAAALLAERVTARRLGATVLVVLGVMLLSVE